MLIPKGYHQQHDQGAGLPKVRYGKDVQLQGWEWIVFENILLVGREVDMGGWGTLNVHVIDSDCQGYNLLL